MGASIILRFGISVRNIRKALKISREELAHKLGTNRAPMGQTG
jgi:DNA-binding transcriptional regulator YiaG